MSKFSVVMLVCSNVARSCAFYRDVLGLKLLSEESAKRVDFKLGANVMLSLHAKSKLLAVRPGSLQLGFSVVSVDRFVSDCIAMGVPIFQDPYDDGAGRMAVISDPDGYPIQIGTLAES